jgi:hypothetical protein
MPRTFAAFAGGIVLVGGIMAVSSCLLELTMLGGGGSLLTRKYRFRPVPEFVVKGYDERKSLALEVPWSIEVLEELRQGWSSVPNFRC